MRAYKSLYRILLFIVLPLTIIIGLANMSSEATASGPGNWNTSKNISSLNSNSYKADMVISGDGVSSTVWQTYNSTSDIEVVRFLEEGGTSIKASNNVAPTSATKPRLVIDSAGKITVFWISINGSKEYLWARSKEAGASSFNSAFMISESSPIGSFDIGINSSDQIVVVWNKQEKMDGKDYMRTYTSFIESDGTLSLDITPLSDVGINTSSPRVDVTGADINIVWVADTGSEEEVQSIYTLEDGTDAGLKTIATSPNLRNPVISQDANGNKYISWVDEDSGTVEVARKDFSLEDFDSFYTLYDSAGEEINNLQISSSPVNEETTVIWTSPNNNSFNVLKEASVFSEGDMFMIRNITSNTTNAYEPSIAFSPDGSASIAWLMFNDTQPTGRFRVADRITGQKNFEVISSPGSSDLNANENTLLKYSSSGELYATWIQYRNNGVENMQVVRTSNTILTNQHTVNVGKYGSGNGNITSKPSRIDCGGECEREFNEGQTVVLTAAGEEGSTFMGWSGDCNTVDSNTCTISSINSDKSVVANFSTDGQTYNVDINKTGSGSGNITANPEGTAYEGGRTYPEGESVTLTATAGEGSEFIAWTGCDSSIGNECNITVTENKSVSAEFSIDSPANLTVNVIGNGEISSTPEPDEIIPIEGGEKWVYPVGTPVVLRATPKEGSRFKGWSALECDLIEEDNSCIIAMNNDRALSAGFEEIKYKVTVNRTGSGSGAVLANPEGLEYIEGTVVRLTAQPDESSSFKGWNDATCDSTEDNGAVCVITMNSDKIITAEFTANFHSINVKIKGKGKGTVISSPAGPHYPDGGKVILEAKPKDKYSIFTGWEGDCSGTSNKCTIAELRSDANVIAKFRPYCKVAKLKITKKVKVYPKKSSSLIYVKVGMPGKIYVKETKSVASYSKTVKKKGTFKLKVKLTNKARKVLKQKGLIRVKAVVSYSPREACKNARKSVWVVFESAQLKRKG